MARRTAEAHDRDPRRLEITTSMPATLDEIPRLAAMGVNRVLVPVTGVAGLPTTIASPEDVLTWRATLDRFAA